MRAERIYLVLAAIGTIVPWAFFLWYFAVKGFAIGPFIGALFDNAASGGFTADLVVSSVVFWIFIVRDSGFAPRVWLSIAANILVGLSLAFPLYLYLRERSRTSEAAEVEA